MPHTQVMIFPDPEQLAISCVTSFKGCPFDPQFYEYVLDKDTYGAEIAPGRTFVDYSVPSILRAAIPVELAGPYNAWRMLLHNGGTLLATTIAAFIPVSWLLALTLVFQLISGLHYFTARDLRVDQQFRK